MRFQCVLRVAMAACVIGGALAVPAVAAPKLAEFMVSGSGGILNSGVTDSGSFTTEAPSDFSLDLNGSVGGANGSVAGRATTGVGGSASRPLPFAAAQLESGANTADNSSTRAGGNLLAQVTWFASLVPLSLEPFPEDGPLFVPILILGLMEASVESGGDALARASANVTAGLGEGAGISVQSSDGVSALPVDELDFSLASTILCDRLTGCLDRSIQISASVSVTSIVNGSQPISFADATAIVDPEVIVDPDSGLAPFFDVVISQNVVDAAGQAAVPLPPALALLLTGLGALVALRRRA